MTATSTALTNTLPILNCSNVIQLSEFVSQMVHKIWNNNNMTMDRLNCFKLFCSSIIKSTQISSSCILVAVFYIYRLRFAYPAIRGSIGSEVRLFTTALVLANKFLDDNTFTNKTWAEVSSIPLRELNIMEMEFLSALQYKTCIHHITFYSWSTQCQYWMTQLLNNTSRPHQLHTPPVLQPQQLQPGKRSADHFISTASSTIKKRAALYYNNYSTAGEGERGKRGGVLSWSTTTNTTPLFHPYHNNYYHQHSRVAASAVATVAAAAAATMTNNVNNIYSNTTTTNNNNNNYFIPRRV